MNPRGKLFHIRLCLLRKHCANLASPEGEGFQPSPSETLKFLEAQILLLDAKIQEAVKVYEQAITLCTTIPGNEEVAAANLVAELGVNMDQFPSAQHLASWAGVCPGNYESAGKRLYGTARTGNTWWRRSLCQAAWAASHTKDTYLAARFHRLTARKGKKRAIVGRPTRFW